MTLDTICNSSDVWWLIFIDDPMQCNQILIFSDLELMLLACKTITLFFLVLWAKCAFNILGPCDKLNQKSCHLFSQWQFSTYVDGGVRFIVRYSFLVGIFMGPLWTVGNLDEIWFRNCFKKTTFALFLQWLSTIWAITNKIIFLKKIFSFQLYLLAGGTFVVIWVNLAILVILVIFKRHILTFTEERERWKERERVRI